MSMVHTREQAPQIVRHMGPVARRARIGEQATGVTGRDIWRIIRRRKWLIILPTVFFTAVAVVGTFLWLRHAPTYTADAFLQVNPGYAGVFERRLDPRADVVERHVLAQAQMVSSRVVLEAALATERVRNLTWYKKNRDDAVKDLKDVLSAVPVPNTDLIRVSVDGPNAEEAAELATAVAEAHVADVTKTVGVTDESTIALLRKQLAVKVTQLRENRNEQQRVRRGASPSDIAAQGGTLRTRLEVFGRQLTQARLAVTQARGINEAVKKQSASGELVNSPEVAAALEADPQLQRLRQSRGGLSVAIESKRILLGEQHRVVKNLKLQMKTVEEQIAQRQKQVRTYQMKALVEQSQASLDSLIAQTLQIQNEYTAVEKRVQDIETILLNLERLTAVEEEIEGETERINRRVTELSLARANRVPVSVRRRAEAPNVPSSPQWIVTVPAGVLLGLVIGLGVAFLLEFVDTSVKSPADVVRRTDLAVLGTVPHTRDLEEDVDDIRRAFADNRDSLVGEAFRHIRTCLQFSGPAEHRRSILITSPLPDDGRTTVTMNLAASLARSGRKVLVVDTNFRQPVISSLFADADTSASGLSNVLVGQARLEDVTSQVEPNLDVMPTGPMPPNPAELLGSEPMRQLLTGAFEAYDQVLLDSAPCLVVTDPAILSTIVDGVVLVVRAGTNTYGMVQRAGEGLTRVGAKVLGTVLNGVRATVGGYLRENYDRFYDYQEQIEPPAD